MLPNINISRSLWSSLHYDLLPRRFGVKPSSVARSEKRTFSNCGTHGSFQDSAICWLQIKLSLGSAECLMGLHLHCSGRFPQKLLRARKSFSLLVFEREMVCGKEENINLVEIPFVMRCRREKEYLVVFWLVFKICQVIYTIYISKRCELFLWLKNKTKKNSRKLYIRREK